MGMIYTPVNPDTRKHLVMIQKLDITIPERLLYYTKVLYGLSIGAKIHFIGENSLHTGIYPA
jgi:hypothetical protein